MAAHAQATIAAPAKKCSHYRQETSLDTRWEDRFTSITGDWSGNVYDFYIRVYNKLKAALKIPFKLEGIERVDDTPAHEALREAIVNCVTNANYYERRGIVCVWRDEALTIANPGDFHIPLEKAMRPGESDPKNATMLKTFAMELPNVSRETLGSSRGSS